MLYFKNQEIFQEVYVMKKWMKKLGFQEMDEMQRLIALKAQRNALIYAVLFLLAWEGWNLFRTLRYETELDNIPGLLLSTITLVLIGSQIYYQQKVLKGSEEGEVYTRSLTRTLILGCLLGAGLAVVGTWLMLR